MNESTKVLNRLQAIEQLAVELRERMSGVESEQHAFWLMVDTKQLDTIEEQLFNTVHKIANEIWGDSV